MRANVPFDFTVGGALLPAGQYVVDQSAISGFLVVQAERTGRSAVTRFIASEARLPRNAPHLVFHRYGDQYFLVQVWTTNSGREIPATKLERLLAEGRAVPGRVVVAAVK